MKSLGLLEEIHDLREVWPHEALDFTPWLAEDENMSLLGDALGMDIIADETESSVGDFNVDITATEVGTDRKIIIENQLEDTNHDHLGKLITYAAGKDARTIVWVVRHARSEHRAAIEWLNNHTDDQVGFFLCEIHLFRIGDSKPAVKFDVVEKPNDWTKSVRKSDVLKPSEQFRLEYWTEFNDFAFQDSQFAKEFKKRKATTGHAMDLSIGSSTCHLVIDLVRKDSHLCVGLYITADKSLFHALHEKREVIDKEVGFPLDWRELPNKKASRILTIKDVNYDDHDGWQEQFQWIMGVSLKLKKVFKKYI